MKKAIIIGILVIGMLVPLSGCNELFDDGYAVDSDLTTQFNGAGSITYDGVLGSTACTPRACEYKACLNPDEPLVIRIKDCDDVLVEDITYEFDANMIHDYGLQNPNPGFQIDTTLTNQYNTENPPSSGVGQYIYAGTTSGEVQEVRLYVKQELSEYSVLTQEGVYVSGTVNEFVWCS